MDDLCDGTVRVEIDDRQRNGLLGIRIKIWRDDPSESDLDMTVSLEDAESIAEVILQKVREAEKT